MSLRAAAANQDSHQQVAVDPANILTRQQLLAKRTQLLAQLPAASLVFLVGLIIRKVILKLNSCILRIIIACILKTLSSMMLKTHLLSVAATLINSLYKICHFKKRIINEAIHHNSSNLKSRYFEKFVVENIILLDRFINFLQLKF